MNVVQQNTPVTAAAIVSAVGLCLAAFTGLSPEQIAAVNAVVAIVAGVLVQRYGTDPKEQP